MAASTSTNGDVGSKKTEMEKKVGNDTCNAAPQSGPQFDKIRDGSSCACECEKKLRDLEVTMNLISAWKDEVDRWMLSNFGFAVCVSPVGADEKSPKAVDPLSQNSETVNGVGYEHKNFEGEVEDNDLSFMNTDETEDVEIMPEIFGHFLLGNDSEESDGSQASYEGIQEGEMEEQEHEQRPNRGKRRRLGDGHDSDSSCYTVSSSSSESMSSDDDDYKPTRGRGRGKPLRGGISRISPQKNTSPSKNHKPGTSASANYKDKIDHATSMDLVRHIRKRPGNVWECNVCSFMLGDFNRMLLHIKYNHSTTTHRCSHCRAIVLCRSPKDVMIHEEQCKLRPVPSTSRCPPPAPVRKLVAPTPKEVRTKKPPVNVDAKVDKFVSELLKPGPSSIPSKNKGKKAVPLDVVTLSSDDED
ncbi:unnamed protein product [Orchesella dallaii]|uniref:C2H2-type domain-containing protein n=1 Tax=Orchesella dallaii TaxID=48710 RepID=A0ABP1QG19_9HEXA